MKIKSSAALIYYFIVFCIMLSKNADQISAIQFSLNPRPPTAIIYNFKKNKTTDGNFKRI
jgi:hypothetical protein